MKTLGVILLVIFSVSGYMIKVIEVPDSRPSLAPSGWVHLQKIVLPLFENVCDESKDPMIVRLAQEFEVNVLLAEFRDPAVITNFQNLKTGKGFLPKGEIFSEYNPEHVLELKIIFDVLYNAKTFDTFFKVAAWARQNLNCGLYVDAIYTSFERRRDTEKLTLPPPYELLPNYFIRKDIIIQGSSLLSGQEVNTEGVKDDGNAYTIDANYTIYEDNDESKLAYFREDIGLNSYYFLKMLKNAAWLNKKVDLSSNYGEQMYFMMKQIWSRYNMERYANGMPEVDGIDWDVLPSMPYDPMLVYSNGDEFISKSGVKSETTDTDEKALLKTIENNLSTVVLHMRESGYNKTQILNHLMEILVSNDRSYDTLARHLLGKFLSNNGNPSVLEHYMTSLRDPLFWKLNKKIVDLVDNALKVLPPYKKNELFFPGVEIVSIDAKKVMTSFDYYQFDISDALKVENANTAFRVKIGQQRLNHKQFTIKVNVTSLVMQKGLLKIYLGPKVMPGEFVQKKNQFALIDWFEINLKRGSNIITRSSDDMNQFSNDFMSFTTLAKKVENAQFGLDSLPLNSMDQQTGYPNRMLIPKGTPSGLPLQLLVFIAPYVKANLVGSFSSLNMEFNNAVLSKLYPFDLPLEDNSILELPNILIKDIMVTHKGVSTVGSSTDKQTGGYNKEGGYSKPNYKKPTDYNYEKNYGPKEYQGQNFMKSPEKDSIYYKGEPESKYGYEMNKPQYDKEVVSQEKNDMFKMNKQQYGKQDVSKEENNMYAEPKEVERKPIEMVTEKSFVEKQQKESDEFIMQGDDANAVKLRQLGSSFDYSTKKKQYDYKTARSQYKKDNKSIYKNRPTTEMPDAIEDYTATSKAPEEAFKKTIEKVFYIDNKPYKDLVIEDMNSMDKNNLDLYKDQKKQEENFDFFKIHKQGEVNFDIYKDHQKEADNFEVAIPLHRIPLQKFTIYDYIIRFLGDDDTNYEDSGENVGE